MSATYEIQLDASAFEPCAKLTGSIRSTGDSDVDLELQLVWTTSGAGDSDRDVFCTERLQLPAGTSRTFAISLPAGPRSFSGALISLDWTLVCAPAGQSGERRLPFVVGPGGEALRLPPALPAPQPKRGAWFRKRWM